MKKYTINEINKLSYTDFVSLIKEENRPSGGKDTIREIAINSFVNKDSKVLEIGCTNGFSSLEINRLVNCEVIGIDINENSIKNANDRIVENGLDPKRIHFEYGNAENLKFSDNEFDLIICGNAISFVNDKGKAISELKRVLKNNGFISMVPIWYRNEPDKKIIEKVNNELGFKIHCYFEKDWANFDNIGMELYYKKNYKFKYASKKQINDYVERMIESKDHLKKYSNEELTAIKKRWKRTMTVFNENLNMANFSIILLRKNMVTEEESLLLSEEL